MPERAKLRFSIARWSAWEPSAPGAMAEVPEVPALLRRRASDADRAALRVAFDCVGAKGSVPAVFCSRHGEVQRSVELLEQLAKGEGLSPMAFSLSVHNAAAALYSLTRGDQSPLSALAAGPDSLPQGMLEACAMLQDSMDEVLLVAYDDALPAAFKPYADDSDQPYALALLLKKAGPQAYSLELESAPAPPKQRESREPQAIQVARFLREQAPELSISSGSRSWTWRKDA